MSIIKQIGNTPLLNIEGIHCKAEFFNPSGSVKDRIANYFIEKAEKTKQLRKGYTIVEASTGNTGTALSMVGAVKGYKVIIYIPKGLSKERYQMMKKFGATIRYTKEGDVQGAREKAIALGKKQKHYHPDQFSNPWNVEEHQKNMGKEILKQLKKVDAIITGIGSGGTLIGLAKAFKKYNPKLKVFGVEPLECAMTYEHMHNLKKVCHPHRIEGIADGFIPKIIFDNIKLIDDIIRIPSSKAIKEAKRIAKEHGCFVGVCSGANLLAAKEIKRKYKLKNVVTVFTDEGEKYLSEKWF
jgi:cysteine synthase